MHGTYNVKFMTQCGSETTYRPFYCVPANYTHKTEEGLKNSLLQNTNFNILSEHIMLLV
jgi:hypothetical protein